MNIKILFYQHIESIGGAEIYLLRLLPHLKNKGIEVGFFCTQTKTNKEIVNLFSSKLSKENIPVIICKASSSFSVKNLNALSKTANQGGYNILSVHLIHAEVATALSKIMFGIKSKIVITKHGYQQIFHAAHGLDHSKVNKFSKRYLTEKFIQHFVSGNIAVSHAIAKFYISAGIVKKNKISVIHHGIDLSYCNSTVSNNLFKNQIIVVGRLIKFKGHHFLLEAIKKLKEDLTDFKLIIVGGGEEKEDLKKLATEYLINDRVEFIGFTNDVAGYVLGSDVVIVPSIAEPFGLVVLEAYCCKKPVISFNVPALNEIIINNETGFLIDDFNTQSMADKIKYLLENKQAAVAFGENGYNLVKQKFTFENSVDKTIKYYRSIFTNN